MALIPDRCPSCGSKKHWKQITNANGEAVSNELPEPIRAIKVPYKMAKFGMNIATLGAYSKAEKTVVGATKRALGLSGGTYHCSKCGLHVTYEK